MRGERLHTQPPVETLFVLPFEDQVARMTAKTIVRAAAPRKWSGGEHHDLWIGPPRCGGRGDTAGGSARTSSLTILVQIKARLTAITSIPITTPLIARCPLPYSRAVGRSSSKEMNTMIPDTAASIPPTAKSSIHGISTR